MEPQRYQPQPPPPPPPPPQQPQPQPHQQPLMCPRCGSTNTKFRYYNNHSLSQPRHYCRDCKRPWTVGGTLRAIPVGGNTRPKHTCVTGSTSGSSSSQQHQPQQLPSGETMPTSFPQPLHGWNFQSFARQQTFPQQMRGSNAQSAPQQTFTQQIPQQTFPQQMRGYNVQPSNVGRRPVGLDQFHYPVVESYQLPAGVVRPTMPMEFRPRSYDGFSFSTTDSSNDGSTSNLDLPQDLLDPTQWPEFPSFSPPK